jgi:hypothetical protein
MVFQEAGKTRQATRAEAGMMIYPDFVVQQMIHEAVLAEREANAKVAEATETRCNCLLYTSAGKMLAAAIRARSA